MAGPAPARWRGRRRAPGAVLLVVVVIALAAVVMGMGMGMGRAVGWISTRTIGSAGPSRPVAAPQTPADVLAAHCQRHMLLNTCRVMTGALPADPAQRVFIAGIGEVDALLYAELRRQGDGMCQSVLQACGAQWDGAPCRIARALYTAGPESPAPAQAGAAPGR